MSNQRLLAAVAFFYSRRRVPAHLAKLIGRDVVQAVAAHGKPKRGEEAPYAARSRMGCPFRGSRRRKPSR